MKVVENQEIVVQVMKTAIKNKGARVTRAFLCRYSCWSPDGGGRHPAA